MSANKLHFETSLDGTGFERGLHAIGHSATHNLKSLVAGAFGVYSLHQALHKTVESAEELVNTSKRLDVTVERLQVLRQAAKEGGVEFGKLASAFERLNVAREKALGGNAKIMAAFARFGVTESDLRNKSAAAIFAGPIANAARTQNVQDLNGPGAAIFGVRQFGQLLPVLRTDLEELEHHMQSLGSIMSTEAAIGVKMLAEQFSLLANIVSAHLAPVLAQVSDKFLLFKGVLDSVTAAGGYFLRAITDEKLSDSELSSPWGLAKGVQRIFKQALEEAGAAAGKEYGESEIKRAELKSMMAAAADRIRNPPKPEIAPSLETKAKANKIAHGSMPDSDALLAVGNFLGSGRGLVNSIAEQHLQIARQQLDAQNTTNDKLDEMTMAIESMTSSGDLDIP